jgi:hypothetical protein
MTPGLPLPHILIEFNFRRLAMNNDKELVPMINIVQYKKQFFIHFANTKKGLAKLLTPGGKIFSGTPIPSKLVHVRKIECKPYNKHMYFQCKIMGEKKVFSCTTGHPVEQPDILALFS